MCAASRVVRENASSCLGEALVLAKYLLVTGERNFDILRYQLVDSALVGDAHGHHLALLLFFLCHLLRMNSLRLRSVLSSGFILSIARSINGALNAK